MKLNMNRVSNHSRLDEIGRKDLVGKMKAQSPTRYNKRLGYHASSEKEIDADSLISKDYLVSRVKVGDYHCIVAYNGIIQQLIEVVGKQPKHNVTLQSVIRAITQAIDKTDILVDCECADFKYRYAYWATKYGYKYGEPETRPAKRTNPDDNIGSMCKHLTYLLANKRWLVKLASVVNSYIKSNIEEIRSIYHLDEDEFYINAPGRPRKSKDDKEVPKKDIPDTNTNDNEDNDDEDLELNIDNSDEESEDNGSAN